MLIYPTLQKEKHSEIYSWLNYKFISSIKESDLLIIIGYSFRDRDITSIINISILTKKLRIIIISPNAKTSKEKYITNDKEIQSRVIAHNFDIEQI